MSSLDLLDYQAGLDAALAKPGPGGRAPLPAGLRSAAVKEARRVVDAMAFRFALMDERPLPEDLDYLRALEAVKPPERAAEVLARRAPIYARARRRRLVTTWTVLPLVVALVGALAWAATSEKADTLAEVNDRVTAPTSVERRFEVGDNITRLHVEGTFVVPRDAVGAIEVFLIDPSGRTRIYDSFVPGGNNYLRENVPDPEPGEWTLLVDYGSEGSAFVRVNGVYPAR